MKTSDESKHDYHNRREDCYYDSEHDRLLGERVIADFIRGFKHAVVVKQIHVESNEYETTFLPSAALNTAFDIGTMEISEKEYRKGTYYDGVYLEGYFFGKYIVGNKISKGDYADYFAQYESYKESFWDNRPDIDKLLGDKNDN